MPVVHDYFGAEIFFCLPEVTFLLVQPGSLASSREAIRYRFWSFIKVNVTGNLKELGITCDQRYVHPLSKLQASLFSIQDVLVLWREN